MSETWIAHALCRFLGQAPNSEGPSAVREPPLQHTGCRDARANLRGPIACDLVQALGEKDCDAQRRRVRLDWSER